MRIWGREACTAELIREANNGNGSSSGSKNCFPWETMRP
jgi:hypothetical protein